MEPPPKPRTPFQEPPTDDESVQRWSRQSSNVAHHLLHRKRNRVAPLGTSLGRIAESQVPNLARSIQQECNPCRSSSSSDGSSISSSQTTTSILFSPTTSDVSSAITSQYSPQPSALASSIVLGATLPSYEDSTTSTSISQHLNHDLIGRNDSVVDPLLSFDGVAELITTELSSTKNVKGENTSVPVVQTKNKEADQRAAEQRYRQSLKESHDNQGRAVQAAGVSLPGSATKKDVVDSATGLIYSLLKEVEEKEKIIVARDLALQQLKRESEYFREYFREHRIQPRLMEDVDMRDPFDGSLSFNPDVQYHDTSRMCPLCLRQQDFGDC